MHTKYFNSYSGRNRQLSKNNIVKYKLTLRILPIDGMRTAISVGKVHNQRKDK